MRSDTPANSPCRDGQGFVSHDYLGDKCIRCGNVLPKLIGPRITDWEPPGWIGVYEADERGEPCEIYCVTGRHDEPEAVERAAEIVKAGNLFGELVKACESFVELFCNSDMRPEDECHELYVKVRTVLAKTKEASHAPQPQKPAG